MTRFLKMLLSPIFLVGAVMLLAAAILLPALGLHVEPTRSLLASVFLGLMVSLLLIACLSRFSVRRHLLHLHGLAACTIILVLAACSATQISAVEAALASPAGQALVTEVESFTPGVSQVIAKINSGIAASASDQQMVCGAMSELNGVFTLVAPLAGVSASAQATEKAAMAGVDTACASSSTDLSGAIQTVLAAYNSTSAALTSSGVAVNTATVSPAS